MRSFTKQEPALFHVVSVCPLEKMRSAVPESNHGATIHSAILASASGNYRRIRPQPTEPTVEQITYTRRKRTDKGEDYLSNLPVERAAHTTVGGAYLS
jgi:hypothetical protein